MKGINKKQEPIIFLEWKAQANEDWQPTFDKLRHPEKSEVRKSLVEEQGYLCAYCCCQIEDDNRTTVIEHFIPQSDAQQGKANALEYTNLFACCDGRKEDDKSEKASYCCDENKKDQFRSEENPTLVLIKPTEKNDKGFVCEQALGYTSDGGIFAIENTYQKQAEYTIEVLNLDVGELRRDRAAAISFLFDPPESGTFFEFTPDEFNQIKSRYTTKESGKFIPYCQTVLYFLNQYYQ